MCWLCWFEVGSSCMPPPSPLLPSSPPCPVLSPTRELAEQTQKVLLAIGEFMSVKCHPCIGGKSIGEDIRRLEVRGRGRGEGGAVAASLRVW